MQRRLAEHLFKYTRTIGKGLIHLADRLSASCLRESESRPVVLREMIGLLERSLLSQLSTNGVVIMDAAGKVVWVNAGFLRMTGYTLDDIEGRTPGSLLQGPDTNSKTEARIRDALRAGHSFREEILNYGKDGTAYWISIECQPIYDEFRRLLGFIAVETDITEARTLEIKLREEAKQREISLNELSEARFRLEEERSRLQLALDAANLGMWDWNLRTNEANFSDTWFTMLGYTPGELPHKLATWEQLCHSDDISGAYRDIKSHLDGTTSLYSNEHRLKTKDGAFRWIKDVGRVVSRDSRGEPERMLGVHIDITAERDRAALMAKARDAAETATRTKSEFLANMSHEIRTPMNGVLGMTQLLLETPLNPDQLEAATAIRVSGESLLRIINDILDFSKIEAKKFIMFSHTFSISEILAVLSRIYTKRAAEQGVSIRFDLETDLPLQLVGDGHRLQQVLVNLIGNAIKFTPRDGVVVIVVRVVGQTDTSATLTFDVIDSGVGIPIEKQRAIFEPFTQVDGSNTRSYGGTGLGLTISAQLVELMGGELVVASAAGLGSTFSFTIDLPKALTQESDSTPHSLESNSTSQRPLSILVAEDNQINQLLIRKILEKAGHTVVLAENGKEAVDSVKNGSFDLIFMDIQMPVMGGEEAVAIIKTERLTTAPIVAITAHALVGDRERYLQAGMEEYITKPIDHAKLIELIARLSSSV